MPLDSRLRFDTLIVGAANRLAAAAARAVAESPGTVYNPLFVYGGPGLGKTHLLGAIAHDVQAHYPALAVSYMPLDDLVEEMHAAIARNAAEQLRERLQKVQVLLLDDVQFLTGRREMQSEMLRLLNTLQAAGRQIVMASDRAPGDIADVDERLISRLSGGLIVDLTAPDYETRVAIVRAACQERAVELGPGVAEELALVSAANVRELQGAFNRLLAHQSLGETVDVSRVRALLGAPPAARREQRPAANEFASFLTDISSAVAEHVDGWRTKVSDAVATWSAAGFRTAPLETLLAAASPPPNWEAQVRGFTTAAERLQALEAAAARLDPASAGAALFRDPENVGEAERHLERLSVEASRPPGPAPEFTRDRFVVGDANRLAVTAADEVVADPGRRYNPLFLHGPGGTGKTHLAHAIGNALVAAGEPPRRVAVVRGREFAEELIAALQEGTVSLWRARYRAVDALIVDDVQAVSGTERTQDELFHVFNALAGAGRQLVFVADRPPQALDGLEERLRSRFEGGLVTEVGAVNHADRSAPRLSMPVAARSADTFFLDDEKVTWTWPDIGARLIEEVR